MSDETQQTTRDVLSAAYDAQVSAAETATSAPEPAVATQTAAPAPAVETATAAAARARDEAGRFAKGSVTESSKPGEESATAPKAGAAPDPGKAKAGEAAPPPVSPAEAAPKPAESKFRPPQSWKAGTREKWASLPPEVQEEVTRREHETSKVLNETAQVRQFASSVQQSLSPYQSIAAANGQDVMTWAGTALQTVAALYAGTPQQKAAVLAQAIAMSGVDVDAINQAMMNPQSAQHQRPAAPPVDPTVAVEKVINERLQKLEAQRADQQAAEFLATSPEFIEDVKEDMVQILQLAAARKQPITYQQAYDRACKLNEGVQKIQDQRKAAEAAKSAAATAQKSQNAASSVRSSPVQASPGQPKGRRAALEAAWDKQSGS